MSVGGAWPARTFSDPRTSGDVCSQEGQSHRCHAFQAKEMNLQKHLPAQGTQDCQARHEDLEHLQDHEHQWDQLHPGKRVGGGAAAVQGQCA